MRISSLRYDNSRRRFSEVQENVVSNTKSKNSDLCSFSRMVKHVEPGNMRRGMEKYTPLFCYCYQLLIVSAPHFPPPPLITIKAATNFSDSE